MDPTPKISPIPEHGQQIPSFEDFVRRFNNLNFHLFFTSGMFGEVYRQNKYYQKFASEHADKAISLLKKIQDNQKLKPQKPLSVFYKDFYEAYKIMRSYDASDKDLVVD